MICTFKPTHKLSFLIANLIDESRSSRFRLRFISMNLLRKSPCCHKLYSEQAHSSSLLTSLRLSTLGQAFDRLVTVNSTHRCASISALSTSSSLRGLSLFRVWISHLEGGFTLRCRQRLALPVLATRPCHWHDNRSTSGRSIPVLSY